MFQVTIIVTTVDGVTGGISNYALQYTAPDYATALNIRGAAMGSIPTSDYVYHNGTSRYVTRQMSSFIIGPQGGLM